MSEQIRMNFEVMRETMKSLRDGSEELEQIQMQIKAIATTLEEGALQGKAGARFAESLTDTLAPEIGRLKEKIDEMHDDVREAAHQMANADKIAGDYYKK